MAATVDTDLGVRRARSTRSAVVTFTMAQSSFRWLILLGVVGVGAAFGGGFFMGQRVPLEQAAPVALAEPETKPNTKPKAKPAPKPAPAVDPKPEPVAKAEAPEVEEAPEPAVAPEPAEEAPAAPTVELREAPKDGFGVQLGAFPSREEAVAFVDENAAFLSDRRVYLQETEVKDKGTWYRVRLGRFGSKSVARVAKRNLPNALKKVSIVVRYR